MAGKSVCGAMKFSCGAIEIKSVINSQIMSKEVENPLFNKAWGTQNQVWP